MSYNPEMTDSESLFNPSPEPPPPGGPRWLSILLAMGGLCMVVVIGGAAVWWASRAWSGLVGTPQPTPVGDVDGQPPAGWALVFDEPFKDDEHQWDTVNVSNEWGAVTAIRSHDTYRWKVSSSDSIYWDNWPADGDIYSDAYITVEAQVTESQPSDDANFGLIFRMANPDNYYEFNVNTLGSFWVEQMVEGSYDDLVRMQTARMVRSHGANTLGVLTAGPHLTFYINGEQVAEVDDASQMAGRIGVFVYVTEAGQKATIEFDNLKVYTP